MVPHVTSSDRICPRNREVVCTFDIVPSPGPPTRALVAKASIFHKDVSVATVRQWHPSQGYDVVALSGPGRFVVGLDICESAVAKAKQWSAAATADGSLFAFVAADFFTWEPPELFDLIFDYTCVIIYILAYIVSMAFL
ncbi:hypothetical protein C2845_PM01G25980 [Panicum miliaceum]|uniref:Uncharacterized protein n=1 Tax=Panicum miliaceum TaxID=4540 RepID=A0A3L6TL05_PANMI|nr:hypothetical protein C2845_PM01G25980 [Panicum miliaceum]